MALNIGPQSNMVQLEARYVAISETCRVSFGLDEDVGLRPRIRLPVQGESVQDYLPDISLTSRPRLKEKLKRRVRGRLGEFLWAAYWTRFEDVTLSIDENNYFHFAIDAFPYGFHGIYGFRDPYKVRLNEVRDHH